MGTHWRELDRFNPDLHVVSTLFICTFSTRFLDIMAASILLSLMLPEAQLLLQAIEFYSHHSTTTSLSLDSLHSRLYSTVNSPSVTPTRTLSPSPAPSAIRTQKMTSQTPDAYLWSLWQLPESLDPAGQDRFTKGRPSMQIGNAKEMGFHFYPVNGPNPNLSPLPTIVLHLLS